MNMEIINYKHNFNQNICQKIYSGGISVPKNVSDHLREVLSSVNKEEFSLSEVEEVVNKKVNENVKKRVLSPPNADGLSSGGYVAFGSMLILSIIVMIFIVILGLKFIIG